MIWIATLCLLALTAWLFFNALNERRWVEAHKDDQTIAADEGLVPTYSRLKRSPEPEGRYSINHADDAVSRIATRVKEKATNLVAGIEQKAAVAVGESSNGGSFLKQGKSMTHSDSILNRAADKLSKVSESLPVEKIVPAAANKGASSGTTTGPIGDAIKRVGDRLEKIQSKVED